MSIWFDGELKLEKIQALGKNTMTEHLGLEWLEAGEDFISARIPVDHRTQQPYGYLHGGASCVLAETLGSVGSAMVVDHDLYKCVGIEINANHIRSAIKGYVTGKATPIHLGRSTHVWEIRIVDDENNLVCVSRITVGVIPRKV